MNRPFRLAVPNKGRLRDATTTLLKDAGLSFEQTERTLAVHVRNVDLDLLFVRTEDVVELVVDGVADLGITGRDLLVESGIEVPVLAELGYGHCQLVAAAPSNGHLDKIDDLDGLRVATAHPRAAADFFAGRGLDVTVVPLRGSVEVAPKLGVADAIVDLVSTGSTMLINGLRPIGTLLSSQAVLVGSEIPVEHQAAADRVVTALRAVVAGRRKRYVLLNAPETSVTRIADLMPGLEAPTVVPLAEDGMVAIHSVVDAAEVWNLLPELEAEGGHGILVLRIEQLVP